MMPLMRNWNNLLYLSGMPGLRTSFREWLSQIQGLGVQRIVCLNPRYELEQLSPVYLRWIDAGHEGFRFEHPAVEDYGAPEGSTGSTFIEAAQKCAADMESERPVVVHCAAGIGRTGTFALTMFSFLEMERQTAEETLHGLGSFPQSRSQMAFVDKVWNERA